MKRLFVLFFLMACASVFADKKAALGGMDGFVERMATGGRELGRGNIGAASFVRCIEGSYTNVVGLPLYETVSALADYTCAK